MTYGSEMPPTEYRAGNKFTRAHWYNRLRCRLNLMLRPSVNDGAVEKEDLDRSDRVDMRPELLERARALRVGLVRDSDEQPYYSKFEHFLKTNGIPYGYYDIHGSRWLEEAAAYQVIVWRPMSHPWELEEAREKIYVLQDVLKKSVYPSFHDIMLYENKLMQFFVLKQAGLPVIDSLVTYDYEEALRWVRTARYPIVSKIRAGSSSQGVTLVRSERMARHIVEKVFRAGRATYWPFSKQKNYVFFQEFIRNGGFDLRIIVVDNDNIFGYYRRVPQGDFRASGYGTLAWGELPEDAIRIAVQVREALGIPNVSVDMLQSDADGRYKIIELSQFIKIDAPSELFVNGQRGRYLYDAASGSVRFEPGMIWPQEIALKNFLETVCAARRGAP